MMKVEWKAWPGLWCARVWKYFEAKFCVQQRSWPSSNQIGAENQNLQLAGWTCSRHITWIFFLTCKKNKKIKKPPGSSRQRRPVLSSTWQSTFFCCLTKPRFPLFSNLPEFVWRRFLLQAQHVHLSQRPDRHVLRIQVRSLNRTSSFLGTQPLGCSLLIRLMDYTVSSAYMWRTSLYQDINKIFIIENHVLATSEWPKKVFFNSGFPVICDCAILMIIHVNLRSYHHV